MEKRIYDLKKRSYAYALAVIHFLESLSKDYISQTVGKQLLRSAASVGANIIEAQAGSSRKDFANSPLGPGLARGPQRQYSPGVQAPGEWLSALPAGRQAAKSLDFYSHALKSANEGQFWLSLMRDSRKISSSGDFNLLDETKELANILASCLLTLKGRTKL